MKKVILLYMMAVLSMMFISCDKDEANNVHNNSNYDNFDGGSGSGEDYTGTGSANQDYPATAIVIHNAVTDIDGNRYDAVRIGDQVWMAENLRTTHYANGEAIPLVNTCSYLYPCRYTPYDNISNVATCGYLYNWAAVMNGANSSSDNPSGVQGICPAGWHVPSDAEWTQLSDYCLTREEYICDSYGNNNNAKALASKHGWSYYQGECSIGYDTNTNNATGFSVIPTGQMGFFGEFTFFWSTTNDDEFDLETHCRCLSPERVNLIRISVLKNEGISVRCVRD